jgi:hypothetical protein
MKAFILEVILPDSWSKVDAICAVNIGLRKHFDMQSPGFAYREASGQRILEDPRGIRTCTTVIAELPLREA